MSGACARRSSQIQPTRPTFKLSGVLATNSSRNMRIVRAFIHFAVRHPLIIFILGVVLALVVVMFITWPMPQAPSNDLMLLWLFIGSIGAITVLVAYILYKLGLTSWFRSLRWTLLAAITLTVVLVFLNVWITARLMFISEHDF